MCVCGDDCGNRGNRGKPFGQGSDDNTCEMMDDGWIGEYWIMLWIGATVIFTDV